jgi:thiamine-phosphate pyrophosphorylase
MAFEFPSIYPILDSSILPSTGRAEALHRLCASLVDAGVTLLEYRNKTGADAELLADATVIRAAMQTKTATLIFDDRADLVDATGFDGVHVDAGDLPPGEARKLLGPERVIGTFGGSEDLLPCILDAPVDYLAIGPVYPTTTKQTSTPPIGPEGVRKLRAQAGPEPVLVAAAGITLAAAPLILAAGANTVAVSAAIFRKADPAAEFRLWMKQLS